MEGLTVEVKLTVTGSIKAVEKDKMWWLWYTLEGVHYSLKPFTMGRLLNTDSIYIGTADNKKKVKRPKV